MALTLNTIPIWLTIFRLVGSPLVLPVALVYVLPFNLLWANSILVVLFALFAFSDFLDGYLARKYNQETLLGKVLDPIADKFLLYSTLIALLKVEKIFFGWVVLLIGRELFMMGLRQVALEYNFVLPVSYLGKLKTTIQMFTFGMIILNPYQQLGIFSAPGWNGLEMGLLLLTIWLSIFSAWQYYKAFMQQFVARHTQLNNEKIDAEHF